MPMPKKKYGEGYEVFLAFQDKADKLNLWLDGIRGELDWIEERISRWADLTPEEQEEVKQAVSDTALMEEYISRLNYLFDELRVGEAAATLFNDF